MKEEQDPSVGNKIQNNGNFSPTESKRSALRFAIARRSHSAKSTSSADMEAQRRDKLIPALSVGEPTHSSYACLPGINCEIPFQVQ